MAKSNRGRKKKYDPNTFPLLVESYARKGMFDKDIATLLDISVNTFCIYINDYPEFREARKRGQKPVNIQVENALLKRALGFEYEEKTTEVEIGSDGQPKPAKIKTVKKIIVGDVGAMAFWLKNRDSDNWKEKKEVEVSGNPFEELMKSATSKDNGEENK